METGIQSINVKKYKMEPGLPYPSISCSVLQKSLSNTSTSIIMRLIKFSLVAVAVTSFQAALAALLPQSLHLLHHIRSKRKVCLQRTSSSSDQLHMRDSKRWLLKQNHPAR
ncbi:hypothetical protein BDZ91DRAFT_730907 [Kalaharituber pfeilii]|nr:hypothetical protein BDZ91DRAFT_730907 [Kalaharituber pfeilii]